MLSWVSEKRVEDPKRIAAFIDAVKSLDWGPQQTKTSIESLYAEVSKLVFCEIKYYYGRKVRSRRLSRIFRLFMITGSTIGVLVPVCAPLIGDGKTANVLSYGYLGFTLTGIAYAADNLFGGTKAFRRRATTQLKLEQLYVEFSAEWHHIFSQLTPCQDKCSTNNINAGVTEQAVNTENSSETAVSNASAPNSVIDNVNEISCKTRNQLFDCLRKFIKSFYECMNGETVEWGNHLTSSVDDQASKSAQQQGKGKPS
jgi:hypothetical protein